jgi:hypothetical protein
MDFDEKPTDYDDDCVCNNMCNFKVSDCMKGIRKVGFTINLDNHNERVALGVDVSGSGR